MFFKIIIKLYYNYILIYKKIKETNKKNNSKLYLFKKNISIFIIIIIVLVVILSNSIKKTEAQELQNQIHKTTLAQNIKSDFEDLEPEELIVETIENQRLESISSPQYLNQTGLLKPKERISVNSSNLNDNFFTNSEHGDVLSSSGSINPDLDSNGERYEIIEYIVQTGDTVSSIADNFQLNVNTILWENDLNARSIIKPGSKLTILPSNGIRHTVAKNENISKIANKYGIDANKIVDSNDIEPDETLKIGQKLFIPGGKKIVETTTVIGRTYSGTTITQNTSRPTNQKPAYTGGKLLWPTVGARITQYYSWSHKGLDIANKTGTPLYAAESGTVERSGWSNGYGYNVVINHGGGLKTLYAHASKLLVKAGDKVQRGDIVANMGSTGWSTGPHIHFEVILNGVKQNPLNYIK
ncbi:MAG: peptidoglycan DD-metalloendopeptidase family protein [Patescibacteria group bacterium]|nr:peptidoglycan DD-metalloendopeptidase family protein [Patescibacteria group bacterium]